MNAIICLSVVIPFELAFFGFLGWFIGRKLENDGKQNTRSTGLVIGLIVGFVVSCISVFALIPDDYFAF
jgi:hypothetical protein